MPTQEAKILLVDDDPDIGQLLVNYLKQFNLQCQAVTNGDAMYDALAQNTFDLVVLDVMLPGDDGFTLCKKLRSESSIPIVMLTARGEAFDRIVGLEIGADDYVVKPFEPRELVARIRSLLRRTSGAAAESQFIQFAGWRLDITKRELTSPEGLLVALSSAEFRLLQAFIQKPGLVLSREQLLDAARGRNIEVFDRSIDLLVSRLRHKLGDDPRDPKLIRTLRGEGYVFNARVSQ